MVNASVWNGHLGHRVLATEHHNVPALPLKPYFLDLELQCQDRVGDGPASQRNTHLLSHLVGCRRWALPGGRARRQDKVS